MRASIAMTPTLLVTLPVVSSAQRDGPCAWVVWVKKSLVTPNEKPLVEWEVPDAFPDRAECLQMRQGLWQTYRKFPEGSGVAKVDVVEDVLVTVNYKTGDTFTTELFCLRVRSIRDRDE